MEPSNQNIRLFPDFPAVSKAQWKEQVHRELKGYETLRWQTGEGFALEPFYTEEETRDLPREAMQRAQPGGTSRRWQNREVLTFTDEKTTRLAALAALSKGADALVFDLSRVDVAGVDFVRLLDAIKLTDTPVVFQSFRQADQVVESLQPRSDYLLRGGLNDDPLAHWVRDGQWPADTWPRLAALLRRTRDWGHRSGPRPTKRPATVPAEATAFRALTVNSHPYHQAGANATQELAFTLAAFVTYLDRLTGEGMTAEEIFDCTEVSMSVGTSYFVEMAKLRAFRYLWQRIRAGYGLPESAPVFLHAQTSFFYDATSEPYTNLLRATTEAMAAVMGGCDALTVHPFDAVLVSAGQPPVGPQSVDDFSPRIARNVSSILKEEAYLDKVADPAAGSYYLEHLTHQLADRAWTLFLEVEALGGLMPAFEGGFVQAQIEQAYRHKVDGLQNGQRIMVGVNKYRSEDGTRKTPAEPVPNQPSTPLLRDRRLAETVE